MVASWRNFRVVENVRLSVQETTSVAETSHRTSDDAEKEWHNGPDKNSGLKDEEDQDSWNEDLTEKVEERNAQEYLLSEMKKTAQNIRDKVEEVWEVLKKIPQCVYGILLVLLRVLLLAGQFLAYVLVLTFGKLKMPHYFLKRIKLGILFAAYVFLNFPCVLSHCEGWFLASDLLNQTLIIRNDHDVYCSFKSTDDTPKTYRCGDNITAHILNNTCMKIKMEEWPEEDCLLEYGRRGRGESSKLEKHFCSDTSVTKPTDHLIGRTHTPAVISSVLLLLALLFVGLMIYLLRKKIKTSHGQETLEEHLGEEEEEGKPKTEKVWEKGRAFLSLKNAVKLFLLNYKEDPR
ncbi:uncharacterized protein LOC128469608 [Spea bombifrons]|uniref:uncharacterized protein LOC128469608 n=1 Tax=Spea bombifrons TaxID=233779 RepID=UPI002349196A|nr:uncharacterized protein LOC128469608 [Spea bombifrons]